MHITITERELKPCPFCGGEVFNDGLETEPEFWVECKKCHTASGFKKTKEEAIEAWNTRAHEQSYKPPEVLVPVQDYDEFVRVKREYERLHNLHKNLHLVNKQLKTALDATKSKTIDCETRELIKFISYAVDVIEKEAKREELLK